MTGVALASEIHGTKWNDLDGDGVLDAGEPGLPNWNIRATGPGGSSFSVVTDTKGDYWFTNLPDGTYTVFEVQQAGWTQTFPPSAEEHTVLLTAGQVITDIDFGNYQPPPVEIHGTKWNDLNNNGVKDGGEPGLAGWTIRATGPTNANAVTDSNGEYTLKNLPAGSYTVGEVQQAGWTQTFPTSPPTYDLLLAPGQAAAGIDFGNYEPPPVEIHGVKWNDLDGDGIRDGGEPGLAGWTIQLDSASTNTSTTTDANGEYWFLDLPADTYTVSEVQQPGWTQTFPTLPPTHTVVILPGQVVNGLNFGNYELPPVEIHGVKWNDLDGDGVRDGGEPGLAGWTIQLDSASTNASTTTDANGEYWFLDLPADTYTVSEVQQPGWTQTFPTLPPTHTVVILPGQVVNGLNFGNYEPPPVEIHGVKWNDLDGDGIRDGGEPGLAGWTIQLDSASTNTSTTTDANGEYWFLDLPADTYTVSEVQQPGWTQTFPTLPPTHTVVILPGQVVNGLNFGNYELPPVEIHGVKWNDLDGDGIRDGGEPGLAGWTIQLDSASTNASATTDANGEYWFLDLPANTYTVSEVQQPGWTQTFPTLPPTHTVALLPGQMVNDLNFGNYEQPSGEIHGMKWNDLDGDGVRDGGEPGLPRWTIQLNSASTNTSTTTDANGEYWFLDLPPGTYTVSEVQQPGWTQTFPVGGFGEAGVHNIILSPGQVFTGIDFGNSTLGSGSGRTSSLNLELSGGSLVLTWGASCVVTDLDYEVYEGDLGVWYSHGSVLCSTGGLLQAVLPIPAGDKYYLIVPAGLASEGSYGESAAGVERPPGGLSCQAQSVMPCP